MLYRIGKSFVSGLGFSVGDVKSGGVSHFWPSLPGPGRQHNEPFWFNFLLETRLKFAILKPLIGVPP